MPLCEMCGKETKLMTANVEGVELKVCSLCTKYGVVKRPTNSKNFSRSFSSKNRKSDDSKIVSNYSSLIHSSRERMGMTQEEFAKSLNERVSLVAKWESGTLKPRLDIARKLGKQLGVSMTEKIELGEAFVSGSNKSDAFTLGDIKVKVRKRH